MLTTDTSEKGESTASINSSRFISQRHRLAQLADSLFVYADKLEELFSIIESTWSLGDWQLRVPHIQFWKLHEWIQNTDPIKRCRTWAELRYPPHVVGLFNERWSEFNKLLFEATGLFSDEMGLIYETFIQPDGSQRAAVLKEFSNSWLTPSTIRIPLSETLRLWACEMAENVADAPPIEADGPAARSTWRHNGAIIQAKLRSGTWDMLDYLWRAPNRSATFDQLNLAVFRDAEQIAAESEYASHVTTANSFFKKHAIPLKSGIRKGTVVLEDHRWPIAGKK